jgi:hypothetical protein
MVAVLESSPRNTRPYSPAVYLCQLSNPPQRDYVFRTGMSKVDFDHQICATGEQVGAWV